MLRHFDPERGIIVETDAAKTEEILIGRAMKWQRKAVTNYCRLQGEKGIGRWWNEKIFFFF